MLGPQPTVRQAKSAIDNTICATIRDEEGQVLHLWNDTDMVPTLISIHSAEICVSRKCYPTATLIRYFVKKSIFDAVSSQRTMRGDCNCGNKCPKLAYAHPVIGAGSPLAFDGFLHNRNPHGIIGFSRTLSEQPPTNSLFLLLTSQT